MRLLSIFLVTGYCCLAAVTGASGGQGTSATVETSSGDTREDGDPNARGLAEVDDLDDLDEILDTATRDRSLRAPFAATLESVAHLRALQAAPPARSLAPPTRPPNAA